MWFSGLYGIFATIRDFCDEISNEMRTVDNNNCNKDINSVEVAHQSTCKIHNITGYVT